MLTIGLDRAGWPFILGAVVVALAGGWLGGRWGALPGALLALGFVFFFRDPDRRLPADQALVVSPADGEVKYVGAAMEGGPAGTWQQITIFLSPLDVHVKPLRKKLPLLGDLVETVRGAGYRFRDEALPATHTPSSLDDDE